MNYGFDYDETISAEPEAFGAIMEALVAKSHEVHIITGIGPNFPSEESRVEGLRGFGMERDTHWTHLHLAADKQWKFAGIYGAWKRDICRENQIMMMFEDRTDLISDISKACRCVLMVPRDY